MIVVVILLAALVGIYMYRFHNQNVAEAMEELDQFNKLSVSELQDRIRTNTLSNEECRLGIKLIIRLHQLNIAKDRKGAQ